jgi:hypothetical protein
VLQERHVGLVPGQGDGRQVDLASMLLNFFPLLLMMRPNKLECLYLAITIQSSLTFVGNTRSLPKKEAS